MRWSTWTRCSATFRQSRTRHRKLPLLTLLKQARAFGVGITLATQNPVDLDYKALSNTGTWFLGKLQTERDKARVLDGLEGLAGGLDRQTMDKALSTLRGRVFLMHNVHEQGPVAFETRWALSYLRGPMGREELQRFASPQAATAPPPPAAAPAATPSAKPTVPAGVREYFLKGAGIDASAYRPVLYGAARIHYTDTRRGVDLVRSFQAAVPFAEGAIPIDWQNADDSVEPPDSLIEPKTVPPATYGALPKAALNPKQYVDWRQDFADWIVQSQPLKLFSAPALKLMSEPDESERDFRIRTQQATRELRDGAVETLRARYAPKVARLEAKRRKAQEQVEREQQQVSQQKLQTAVSLGATMVGALMGRRAVSLSTLGRATTAARGVSRSMKEGAGRRTRARESAGSGSGDRGAQCRPRTRDHRARSDREFKRTARCDRDQAQAGQRRRSTRRPRLATAHWLVVGWLVVKSVQRSHHQPRST